MYYCNYIIIYNHYFMSQVLPKLYDFIIHILLVELNSTLYQNVEFHVIACICCYLFHIRHLMKIKQIR